jgi:hypothetical protein
MTDEEVQPYVGKPVRVTLADGTILAGVLHGDDGGHGHGHAHYAVESRSADEAGTPVHAMIHGSGQITEIEDASDDPAASE